MAIVNLTKARKNMVDRQLRRRGIIDPLVLNIMESLERHQFVDKDQVHSAYNDGPLPIGSGQTISQPYIVAFMTEELQVEPGSKVLEIGTGCGYQTAVLAQMAKKVISVEIHQELADAAASRLRGMGYNNIEIHQGNGRLGWPPEEPFDRIIVTAAPKAVPDELVRQLAPLGRMIIPVGITLFHQRLEIFTKAADGSVNKENSLSVRFVPLV